MTFPPIKNCYLHSGICFLKFQIPVTNCSGELWSILVSRLVLAHSANLRSRLLHKSSVPGVAYSTGCFRVVTPIQVLIPLDGALTEAGWSLPLSRLKMICSITHQAYSVDNKGYRKYILRTHSVDIPICYCSLLRAINL